MSAVLCSAQRSAILASLAVVGGAVLYGAASALFFIDVARSSAAVRGAPSEGGASSSFAACAPALGSGFMAHHVFANLIGVALFVLAGASATLYLVQEKRLKQKRLGKMRNLPPLDTLDRVEHRFLIAGFPLLTIGIVTGTFW